MSSSKQFPWTETDAMFLLLAKRAADLRARSEAADEEERDCLLNVMEAYEAKRWPADADIHPPLTGADQTYPLPRT